MEAPTSRLLHEIGLRVDEVCPQAGDIIAVVVAMVVDLQVEDKKKQFALLNYMQLEY
jgi:hypothetical protein